MSQNPQEITEAKLAAFIDGELSADERAEIEALLARKPQYRPLLEELGRTRDLLRTLPRETAPPELAEAFNSQLERSVLLDGAGEYDEPRVRVGTWPRILARAAIFFLMVGLAAAVYLELPNHPFPRLAKTGPNVSASQPSVQYTDSRNLHESNDGIEGKSGRSRQADQDDRHSKIATANMNKQGGLSGSASQSPTPNLAALAAPDALDVLANDVSQDPRVQQLLDETAGQGQINSKQAAADTNAVVMVVRSSDPAQVRTELAGFLARNNIAYQAAPAPMEIALNSAIQQNASQYQQTQSAGTQVQENLNNSRGRGATTQMAKGGVENGSFGKTDNESVAVANAAQSTRDVPNDSGSENSLPQSQEKYRISQKAMPPGAGGGVPAPGPSGAATPVAIGPAAAAPGPNRAASHTQSADPSAAQSAGVVNQQQTAQASGYGGTVDKLYVARQLSPRQARELNECLARNGQVRQAGVSRGYANANTSNTIANAQSTYSINQNEQGAPSNANQQNPMATGPANSYARPPAAYGASSAAGRTPPAPTSQAVDVLVRPGDTLRLRYSDAKGGKEETQTVQVRPDGAITPPSALGVGGRPVQVAGKTADQAGSMLRREIEVANAPAGALKDLRIERISPSATNSIAQADSGLAAKQEDASVHAREPGANQQPLSATSVQRTGEEGVAPTQMPPAPRGFAGHPTTVRTTALVDANAPVDVVIVVQNELPSAPPVNSIPPTTRPVPSPLQQTATPPATRPTFPDQAPASGPENSVPAR